MLFLLKKAIIPLIFSANYSPCLCAAPPPHDFSDGREDDDEEQGVGAEDPVTADDGRVQVFRILGLKGEHYDGYLVRK